MDILLETILANPVKAKSCYHRCCHLIWHIKCWTRISVFSWSSKEL